MSLPWVRLDSNIYSHDKILLLVGQRDGWRAYGVYTFALAYAGGHATDGHIPRHVLPIIQGTERIATMLVEARLWEHAEGGWQIKNWDERQELAIITEAKRAASRLGGRKRSCIRYHGTECGCWREPESAPVRPLRGVSNG